MAQAARARRPRMRLAALAVGSALATTASAGDRDAAAPGGAATSAAVAAPPSAATIPARFLGVWDSETGTCAPESDFLLRIAPNGIGFIESYGTLTHVTESPDGEALIGLAMEGEGEQWETTITLSLMGQGADERLVVPFEDRVGMPVPLRLKRCPA